MTLLVLQKADGTCNTNFKKTQKLEQVTKVLEDFVDGNCEILVSGTPMPPNLAPHCSSQVNGLFLWAEVGIAQHLASWLV